MQLRKWATGACLATLCFISPAWAQSDPLTALCAPYALYPDTLLAQVLAASTYPDQVMAAVVWCKANPLQGDALATALKSQPWEPSVEALCTFPDVLQKMTDDMENTRALGQDFLADKAGVMDCVQTLRAQAQQMGALQDSPQQKIVTDNSTIQIQPADPDTVYVPTYDATALYGSSYPYGAGLLAFGTGVALGAAYNNNYGAFNWTTHSMYCGAAVRATPYGAAGYRYSGAAAWGHNYGAGGAVHTGSTGVYRGPAGNTSVYHTGTTAAGYRGYGAAGGGYRSGSTFATTAGGGGAAHYSSRGYASMGRAGGFRR